MASEKVEHLGEERVGLAVIEGDVGRRPDDDDHAVAVGVLVRHGRVGLEVGEVVLLL